MAEDRQDLSLRHSGISHQAIPSGIFVDPILKGTDRNVLCVMRSQMGQDSKLVMPTYREIKRMANIGSDATVSRAISILRLTRWIVRTEVLRDVGGRIIRVVYDICDEPESLQSAIQQDTGFLDFVETSQFHYHPAVAHAARMAQGGIDAFLDEVAAGKRSIRSLTPTEKQEVRQQSKDELESLKRGDVELALFHFMQITNKVSTIDDEDAVSISSKTDEMNYKTRLQKMKSGSESADSDTRLQFLKSQNNQTSKNEALSSSSSFLNTTTTRDGENSDSPSLFWPPFMLETLSENERLLILRKLTTAKGEDQQPLINQLAGRMKDRTQPELEDPVKYMFWLIKHHMSGEDVLTSFSTRDYRKQTASGESKGQRKQILARQLHETESKINTIRTMMEHASTNPALRQQLEQSLQLEEARKREMNEEMQQFAEN